MYMSTLNPPKIFLAENELLDDENYIPGLLHHGNIIIQTFAIVSGVLSLWSKHPVFTPPTWVIEESPSNTEVSFAEYLRTWWYPVWKDILWDTELSIEAYLLGKYITLQHPFWEQSEQESLESWIIELDNLLSVYTWSEEQWITISWEALENIHNTLIYTAKYLLSPSLQEFRISLWSGRSVDLLFFIKHEKDIGWYIREQALEIAIEFYKKSILILKDIYNLELARVEGRTIPLPEATEDLPEEIQKIIDTVKI